MPEFPEMEAWRRQLNDPVSAFPIEKAGPAHIATLKTFDPPLSVLDGEGLAGVRRRGKRFLIPRDDEEVVLMVHLMSAGRLRYLKPTDKRPSQPAFRIRFTDGGELVLTEGGPKKRAGVWLLRPDQVEEELAHLGPEADTLEAEQLREILARIGWELVVVPLPGYTIHLDLHLAMVDVDRALVDVPGLPFWFLEELRRRGIEALYPDPGEAWALNALCLRPGRVLMAEGSPRTVERLEAAGVEVVTVPYAEIHKGGGGVHCSTMELLRDDA